MKLQYFYGGYLNSLVFVSQGGNT